MSVKSLSIAELGNTMVIEHYYFNLYYCYYYYL
uniref:Uncharacterized protein n=1 Tax=Anguilla anguilla TaxID=7936 RepID=A0A0E9Y2L0_ANGAN